MEFCTSCGHQLGVGRFCTNCGQPIDAIAPPPPPPAPAPTPLDQPIGIHRGPLPWLPRAILGTVLLLVAALAIVLLTGRDENSTETAKDPVASGKPSDVTTPSPPAPPPTASLTPTSPSTPPATPHAQPEDVARFATATVPDTAPPNQDVDGNQVRYEARNMLDGVPETCWRMPGDGTGSEITIQLAGPTTVTVVGLINGYAKTATGAGGDQLNWYTGNRRIQSIEWVFDDGTVLAQNLTETHLMQTIAVDKITTSTILVRLLAVSAPGTGRAARDYTPISDLSIVGSTSG